MPGPESLKWKYYISDTIYYIMYLHINVKDYFPLHIYTDIIKA